MQSRRRKSLFNISHHNWKKKKIEDPAGSLIKSPIIDRFLQFKDQFCSIFCKHFISVLYFVIPILCFATQIDSKFLTDPKYLIQGDAGRRSLSFKVEMVLYSSQSHNFKSLEWHFVSIEVKWR